jgi:hypothetical protein
MLDAPCLSVHGAQADGKKTRDTSTPGWDDLASSPVTLESMPEGVREVVKVA